MRNTNDLIDAVTAATILGISRSQLNRRAATGTVPFVTKAPGIRGAYIFRRAVIERLAERAA